MQRIIFIIIFASMKRYLLLILFAFSAVCAFSQGRSPILISDIQQSGHWYDVYDQNGKRQKSFSISQGTLVGFSSNYYILRSGNWYYLFTPEGRRYKTLYAPSVGEIRSVAGNTFTAQQGHWIYTFDQNGKRLSTRSAR